jgi:hypothetical protein
MCCPGELVSLGTGAQMYSFNTLLWNQFTPNFTALSLACLVNPMSESQRILAKIGAEAFSFARRSFPPASLCSDEFMEGESTDVDGRLVIIKFRRTLYKRHKTSWHAWNLYSARYVEPASVGDAP